MAHIRLFTPEFMRDLQLPPKPRDPSKSKKKAEATYIDTLEPGKALILRVSYGGRKAWKVMFYIKVADAQGRPRTVARSKKLGRYPTMSIADAYAKAREFDQNKGAAAFAGGTFGKAAQDWLEENAHFRSAKEIRRHLESYVLPQWGEKQIHEIRRREVNDLLDQIKKKRVRAARNKRLIGGVSQADAVLATIRSVMMFHTSRDDEYDPPITPRMKLKRDKRTADEKQRKRVLTDDEIRGLWAATGKLGNRGALIRLLLLTGQRLRKVAHMKRSEIADGMWTIPREPREKGNAGTLKLPEMALGIVTAQEKFKRNEYLFPAGRGKGPINSFSELKCDVDALLPKDMPHWTLHDLRRTARTRMADLDIDDKIAELTLGHKIKGIEAVYNRADYIAKKSAALARLAAHIADVLEPKSDPRKVVSIRKS